MSLSKVFLDFISNVNEEQISNKFASPDIKAFVCGLELLDRDLQLCDFETCSKLVLIIDWFLEKVNEELLTKNELLSFVKLALQICVKKDVLDESIYKKLFTKVLSLTTKMQLTSVLITYSPNFNVVKSSIQSIFVLIFDDLKQESKIENSNILVSALFDLIRIIHSKNLHQLLKHEIDLFCKKIVDVDGLSREKLLNVVSCLVSSEIDSIDKFVNTSLDSPKIRSLLLDCLCFKDSGIVRKKARFCSLKMNIINFDVWLLLESLEEKQRHLIEPLLATKLNCETTLIDCIKGMDENERNLLEVVIERMLCHDNKHIRRYAFSFVSNSVFNSNCGINHRFLLETCVYHLQDNAIYTSDESVFSLKFLLVLPLCSILERLVQLQGNLSPIAIYHILKQVSEDVSIVTEERVNKIIVKNLLVIVFDICADVCLRAAIQVLLVKAIARRCPEDVIDMLVYVNEDDVNISKCIDVDILNASMVRIDKYLNEKCEDKLKLIARFFGMRYEKCCKKSVSREINEALQKMYDSMIEVFLLQMLQVVMHVETEMWSIVKNHMKSMNTLKLAVILSKKILEEDVKQELIAFLRTKLKLKEISWDYMAVMCELHVYSECNEVCKTLCDTIDFWLRLNTTLQCFKEECFWICLIFYTKFNRRANCFEMLSHFQLISQDECRDINKVKDALCSLIAITPITFNRYLIKFYGLLLRNELLANNCSHVCESANDQPISRLFSLLCNQLFSACLELKKNEFWKQTFHNFIIEFAFREELLIHDLQDLNLEFDQCYSKLQRLEIPDLSASLIRHLSSVVSNNRQCIQLELHSQLILNALIDGITFTRYSVNQVDLIVKQIGEDVNISDCLLVANPFNFHHKTRLSVLERMSNMNRYEIIVAVTRLLMEKENKLLLESKYSFLNSTLHRTQTKIWQFHFLILQTLLNGSWQCLGVTDNEWVTLMFSYTTDCLINQQKSQMSVQILQQLIVIQLLLNEKTSQTVWPLFYEILQFDCEGQLFDENEKKPQNSRIGSLVPFLSIVYHLIDKKPQLKYFPISCLLSCQHYKVRLLAHLVLQKATSLIDIISNSYKFLIPPVPRGSANVNRNLTKIRDDWFYSAFDAENDCTLQFVLHYLPKLTNCSEEDVIPLHLINTTNFNKAIKLSNAKSALPNASPSVLRDKSFDGTKCDILSEKSNEVFQKKYSVAEMCFNVKRESNEGLIVCATLLDRAPNLGGLCRTCEVFGVRKLVISNASILEDKDFVQLSVSSQKWVNIEEVKKNDLSTYLTTMRRDYGYTLIAVEQTTGSKPLNHYKFPEKSLIILGNEREGLPVEYLHQVDECIEIPQSGFIRSLNVHVTGAIIIWEYYKQMMESCDS